MFGITTFVKGYSIQAYFLYCYATFISEVILRQRGGVTFGTPCTTRLERKYGTILSRGTDDSLGTSTEGQ